MPFCYQHPDYWYCIAAESKRTGDMVTPASCLTIPRQRTRSSRRVYSRQNIRGKLLLIGAEDDVLWDAARYIHRMEKRLAEKPHECEIETMVYTHGTTLSFGGC